MQHDPSIGQPNANTSQRQGESHYLAQLDVYSIYRYDKIFDNI